MADNQILTPPRTHVWVFRWVLGDDSSALFIMRSGSGSFLSASSQLWPKQAIFQLLIREGLSWVNWALGGVLPRWPKSTCLLGWSHDLWETLASLLGLWWTTLSIYLFRDLARPSFGNTLRTGLLSHVVHIFILTRAKLFSRKAALTYIFTSMNKGSCLPVLLQMFSIFQLSNFY